MTGPRRAVLGLCLGVCATGLGPERTRAQAVETEPAIVLLETAQTFEERGRWGVAEAIYQLILERYPDTPAAVIASERLAEPPPEVALGDGSVELQVWSTLYGTWLGIAVPGAFGADSPEPYGAGVLLGGLSGFLTGRSAARATELTEGQAGAISLGAWWGTWQGFGWQEVFDLGVDRRCDGPVGTGCYDTEDTEEEAFAAMILGGLTGLTTGALLARRELTPGTMTTVNFGTLWGTWFGAASGVLLGLDDDDLLAATLLGGNSGLLATALLAPGWNTTRSRARLVSLAGLLGGLAGGGLDLLLQPDDDKVAIAIPLAGSIAGLAIGVSQARSRPRQASRDDTRAAGMGVEAPGSVFLRFREGQLSMTVPIPTPTLVRAEGPKGPSYQPALWIDLLRASF